MAEKYYIAYGSNLNVAQMRIRCPGAKILGTAELNGWELLFKGSKTGSYLTIERSEFGKVPVAVWSVRDTDEAALDRYEGYPAFYYKKAMKLRCKSRRTGIYRTVSAFVYIMHEKHPVGIPSPHYVQVCLEGYRDFGFDENVLLDAFDKSVEVCKNEG